MALKNSDIRENTENFHAWIKTGSIKGFVNFKNIIEISQK